LLELGIKDMGIAFKDIDQVLLDFGE
jgi:hypothetical protein